MSKIGIIANPTSGKDIRRLVGQALIVTNREKVNIVKRVIIGLHSAGIKRILIMPDRFGIGSRAIQDLLPNYPAIKDIVEILDLVIQDAAIDSTRAAEEMRKMGVKGIITLGGDGTVRVVAKGAGETPLLPISTGTNNVLPQFVEGTIAGRAAAKFANADKYKQSEITQRQKKLEIFINGELRDFALVDVVAAAGMHIGSRAVWEPESIRQIAVTRATKENIGFSNIIAGYEEIKPYEPFGMMANIVNEADSSFVVTAAIGPGMISEFQLKDIKKMVPEKKYVISSKRPMVLALDGEREHTLKENEDAYIKLSLRGPYFINIHQALLAKKSRRRDAS